MTRNYRFDLEMHLFSYIRKEIRFIISLGPLARIECFVCIVIVKIKLNVLRILMLVNNGPQNNPDLHFTLLPKTYYELFTKKIRS